MTQQTLARDSTIDATDVAAILDADDQRYRERVGRGCYLMPSPEGDAAVAAVVEALRARMAAETMTAIEVRSELQKGMADVNRRFVRDVDSEVWIHLVMAFIDIIPDDAWWPRGWLTSEDPLACTERETTEVQA